MLVWPCIIQHCVGKIGNDMACAVKYLYLHWALWMGSLRV
jgi:hypothetical protein